MPYTPVANKPALQALADSGLTLKEAAKRLKLSYRHTARSAHECKVTFRRPSRGSSVCLEDMRALAASGSSVSDAARHLGCLPATVAYLARKHSIAFNKKSRSFKNAYRPSRAISVLIELLKHPEYSFQAVAEDHRCSREFVGQVAAIIREHGLVLARERHSAMSQHDIPLLDWASSNVTEARFITEDTDRPYWRVTTSFGDHLNYIGLGDTLRSALDDARRRLQLFSKPPRFDVPTPTPLQTTPPCPMPITCAAVSAGSIKPPYTPTAGFAGNLSNIRTP